MRLRSFVAGTVLFLAGNAVSFRRRVYSSHEAIDLQHAAKNASQAHDRDFLGGPTYALCIASLQDPNAGVTPRPEAYQGWEALSELENDVNAVCGLLQRKGAQSAIKIGYAQNRAMRDSPVPSRPMITRSEAINLLQQLVSSSTLGQQPLFFYYFSGHGHAGYGEDDAVKGGMVFQRDVSPANRSHFNASTGTIAEYLTFYDVLNVWRVAKPQLHPNARFVMMADSCYSGKLVKQLRDVCSKQGCAGLNMAIQSAGDARQSVMERRSNHGGKAWDHGELTGWWLARNAGGAGQVRYSTTRDNPQWPQYFASWVNDDFDEGPVHDLDGWLGGGLDFMQRWRN